MGSLNPEDKAAFNRLVIVLESDDISRESDMQEMRSKDVQDVIEEGYRDQQRVVRQLLEHNREGLLEALAQCTSPAKDRIAALILLDADL